MTSLARFRSEPHAGSPERSPGAENFGSTCQTRMPRLLHFEKGKSVIPRLDVIGEIKLSRTPFMG